MPVDIMMFEHGVYLVFVFLVGSVIGSLLNVCIHRLSREERFWAALKGLVYPPSHCPRCAMPIPWRDNIPIVGWLLVGGRCRNCRGRVSIRYPLIELLTATLFVLVYWCEVPGWWAGPMASSLYHPCGPSAMYGVGWISMESLALWRYGFHMTLVVALIVATFIDFDLKIIPDTVTLPAMATGVLGNCLLGRVYIVPLWYQTPEMQSGLPAQFKLYLNGIPGQGDLPAWLEAWTTFIGVPSWMTAHPMLHGLLVSLAGIVAGGGIVWGVRMAGYWGLKREAMGFGDVVLLATIGSFIGWQAAITVFFIGVLCALVAVALSLVVRFDREIAFGPYLSLATLILLLAWKWIWPTIESILVLGPFLPLIAVVMCILLWILLYLLRVVKTLLGIQYDQPEFVLEWSAADQLAHYSGECVDDRQGQWPRDRWRGALTGRGLAHDHIWRHGAG